MWQLRPPRDPLPFMANAILNFHFDYWHTSLIDFERQEIFVPERPKQVAQETRKTELWQERQHKGQAVCKCTAQEESCKKMQNVKLEERKNPANGCKNIQKVEICIEQDPRKTSEKNEEC